ncbi:META domain-containing protein [Rheinheimera salexigens]|uniref:Heat-shock protein n=1 Tax=Rheinheimera salexigens TaxID=1628148 RepID=A0A1E7Q735_9GAMM|nr:META domain-containing protein [Rheinheimera salexigens]OEY70002.1 heat-shock protein [Rheinheimera salexigens]
MKKRLLFSALLLSACTPLPPSADRISPAPVSNSDTVQVKPDTQAAPVVDSSAPIATTTESQSEPELITINNDMSFIGVLPCADCPGISYHINLFRDGRFEARQEYLERNYVNIVKGIWLLDNRNLHLVNQQENLPGFHFTAADSIVMLGLNGQPIRNNNLYQLQRDTEFRKLDTRQAMLGSYQLSNNIATFTSCNTGESFTVANTQHHLPVMRQYQQNHKLKQQAVIATLVGRKGQDEHANKLFIDSFDQFWPGANCAKEVTPDNYKGIVWRADKFANAKIPPQLKIKVVFAADDTVYGFSGCNNFSGKYQQQASQLTVQSVASTRKMCATGNSEEQRFMENLQNADRAEINGKKLQLFRNNRVVLQFSAASN